MWYQVPVENVRVAVTVFKAEPVPYASLGFADTPLVVKRPKPFTPVPAISTASLDPTATVAYLTHKEILPLVFILFKADDLVIEIVSSVASKAKSAFTLPALCQPEVLVAGEAKLVNVPLEAEP